MASHINSIQPDTFYHIYNRAIGNEILFDNDHDCTHWLGLIKKYILPVCEIHSYCLLPNHYHLLVKTKSNIEDGLFSKQMSNAANAFTKWKNLSQKRKGGLFMTPFKRKHLDNEAYLIWCLWYIHRNPFHHKYTSNWEDWKYSSYMAYLLNRPTLVTTNFFVSLLGGTDALKKHHQLQMEDEVTMKSMFLE